MRCKSISEFIMCFMLSLFSLTAFAQIKITGTASDAETGEPLSFITIQIKGTTAGTTSDMDGNYSIEVPNRDAILVYSYIGYRSQEIKVGNQTHINVRLSEDVETLDEVVVVGYGVQNKRDVTGSIAKVGSEELMSVPTSSFDAALQGRAAGVQVTQTSGLAGSGAAIRVRGIASITAGGDPLIVVDGIPIMQNAGDRVGAAQDNPMSSINANDIESIDILKDASATAIYGSRGANGVVLITTKRGKSGKPQINFSSKVAFSTTNRKVDMLETKDYLDIYKEALENDYKFNPSGATDPSTVSSYPGGYSEEQALLNNMDGIIIGYNELLLLYAESLAKSNGNMNQALNALQKIEKRAYGKANTTTTDRASFIKAVQKERRLEIALQGERLFELKRIKQSVRGEAWDSHKVMFQIPDVEQNGNPDVNMN